MHKEDGITKLIDGEVYYKFDYANFLYEELQKKDDEIDKYKKVINEIKEKIDDYFGYDYKNESQARLDTINEINNIIVDLYNGGDEE